jgi:hypothetical protein
VAAEAGAGVGQLVLGPGDGLLGVPLIAPVQRDQGAQALDQDEAVALAGRRHQLQHGVELGAGVVPPAGQEPLQGQVGFVEG